MPHNQKLETRNFKLFYIVRRIKMEWEIEQRIKTLEGKIEKLRGHL